MLRFHGFMPDRAARPGAQTWPLIASILALCLALWVILSAAGVGPR